MSSLRSDMSSNQVIGSKRGATFMSHRISRIGAAAMLAALSASAQRAEASSHRESLAIIHDPCVDSTDVYAWVTPTSHDKLNLIVGYNGLHEPGQGNHQTKLCDNVLY